MTEQELQKILRQSVANSIRTNHPNIGMNEVAAALREAWDWMARRADDAKCEHSWFDDGVSFEHNRWLSLLKDKIDELIPMGAGDPSRDFARGWAASFISKIVDSEKSRNLPPPMLHDQMRLRHDRMGKILKEIIEVLHVRVGEWKPDTIAFQVRELALKALERDQ